MHNLNVRQCATYYRTSRPTSIGEELRLEGMKVCIQSLAQRFKLKYRYVALSYQIPRFGVLLSVIVGLMECYFTHLIPLPPLIEV